MPNVLYSSIIEVEERICPVKGTWINNEPKIISLPNDQKVI
jgi:hypothetical protein